MSTINIRFINNIGNGFSGIKQVPAGQTLGQFCANVDGTSYNATNYTILVNKQVASVDYVLRENDRVSITPIKVAGAAGRFYVYEGDATEARVMSQRTTLLEVFQQVCGAAADPLDYKILVNDENEPSSYEPETDDVITIKYVPRPGRPATPPAPSKEQDFAVEYSRTGTLSYSISGTVMVMAATFEAAAAQVREMDLQDLVDNDDNMLSLGEVAEQATESGTTAVSRVSADLGG